MAKALVDLVMRTFPDAVVETHAQHGDETIVVDAARWKDVAVFLKTSPAADMAMLMDLTAVDFPHRSPRFEIVAHLYSLTKGHRLRLKARVGKEDGTGARIATVADLWASANWMEREAWDMFGVVFEGHPDLRRILMYPEFEGHPLRKDYAANHIQPLVEYREDPSVQKVAPFGADEGMSFGRQQFDQRVPADLPDTEVFPAKPN